MDILLIDDDPGDTMIIEEALEHCAPGATLRTAPDGVEAMAMLRGMDAANHPDLILLDLNMPRMNGREVLAELKADETMQHIPVVVLTTSAAHEDVLGIYRLHANAYVTKPVDLNAFAEVIEKIDTFYGHTAALPRPDSGRRAAMTTPGPQDREQVDELLQERAAEQQKEADAEAIETADRPRGAEDARES